MSGRTICGFCKKPVMFVEQQAYKGGYWHDFCFKCQKCNKRLATGEQVDHQDLPYCKSCYDKNFRVKGYGFGSTTVDSFQNK